jgi:hypothetical protein
MLTNGILIIGLGLVIVTPCGPDDKSDMGACRLLIFGLLAIPGNVDNLLPQMRGLDPTDIADNTMAAVIDRRLLLLWAIVLTLREGLPTRIPVWLGRLAVDLGDLSHSGGRGGRLARGGTACRGSGRHRVSPGRWRLLPSQEPHR